MIQPINTDKCVGCGFCVECCPMDVIRMDPETGKAKLYYVNECQCCVNCEDACPQGAIFVTPEHYTPPMLTWF